MLKNFILDALFFIIVLGTCVLVFSSCAEDTDDNKTEYVHVISPPIKDPPDKDKELDRAEFYFYEGCINGLSSDKVKAKIKKKHRPLSKEELCQELVNDYIRSLYETL